MNSAVMISMSTYVDLQAESVRGIMMLMSMNKETLLALRTLLVEVRELRGVVTEMKTSGSAPLPPPTALVGEDQPISAGGVRKRGKGKPRFLRTVVDPVTWLVADFTNI